MRKRPLTIERNLNNSLKAFYFAMIATACLSIPLMLLLVPIAPWAAFGLLIILSLAAIGIGLYTLDNAAKLVKCEQQIAKIDSYYPLPKHVSTVKLRRISTGTIGPADEQGAILRMKSYGRLVTPDRLH